MAVGTGGLGDQIGAVSSGDHHLDHCARLEVVGNRDDPVDLRCLPIGPSLAHGVDQDLDHITDEPVPPLGGDRVLELGTLAQAFGHQLLGDLIGEVGGERAVLAAEGEEPHPVQLGLAQPGQELVVVGLGLARIADDERGPEGGRGLGPADVADAVQEALALPPSTHALEQGTGHVLQRQVEVGHAGGQDGLDQRIVQARRVQIQQPSALYPLGHGPHQVHDGAVGTHGGAFGAGHRRSRGTVESVGGQVLGHQHDLAQDAVSGTELVGLGQDDLVGSGALLAPERRDGAEPAIAVTALGHLDVGPRGRGRRPGQVEQIERWRRGLLGQGNRGAYRSVLEGDRARCDRSGQLHPKGRHQVHLGQGGGQLIAVALGHATGHHQAGAGPAGVVEGENGVDGLLPRRLDEGAGIDHHQVGLLGRGSRLVAALAQGSGQLLRVDLVLRTAQRLQPVTLSHQDNLPGT